LTGWNASAWCGTSGVRLKSIQLVLEQTERIRALKVRKTAAK
jgi:hypothetical protein